MVASQSNGGNLEWAKRSPGTLPNPDFNLGFLVRGKQYPSAKLHQGYLIEYVEDEG
jgi:hypothetical protein